MRNIERPFFQRPPRFLPEMPSGDIDVPNPPGFINKPEISWMALLLPPVAAALCTAAMVFFTGGNSVIMALFALMTVSTVLVSLLSARRQIKKFHTDKKIREQKYLALIADIESDLKQTRQQQKEAVTKLNPPPKHCLAHIKARSSTLWERTPAYEDFLSVRLGIGAVAAKRSARIVKAPLMLENDPLMEEPERLLKTYARITDVPVCLDLFGAEICGFAGARADLLSCLFGALTQIVTHHSYNDVKLVLLFPETELADWTALKSLPHLWTDDFSRRFFACGKPMAHQILSELTDVLKDREAARQNDDGPSDAPLPHFVFIVADRTLLEDEPITRYLYRSNKSIGLSCVFLAERKEFLPTHCSTVVSINSNGHATVAQKQTGEVTVFQPDRTEPVLLRRAAAVLAPLRMKQPEFSFRLPKTITLLALYKANRLEDIDIFLNWTTRQPFKGMAVPIGASVGGALFHLDMQAFETSHGPHGLVAGTTGSGKSELLQTIIISLAMNFNPHDVVFVLIDYKGGGMADIFRGMPHLVGTVTNLGGNETHRALLSIKSELKRRQEIFARYKVNNIDQFQKLYHADKTDGTPIPRLIMIADEFAELKAEQPGFMKELVSAARVGRSLGVHLILATQKPTGVVDDQIWSNSRFKICLKVQDESDSRDVIKKPDAARIKEPGRAYIQVGSDEIFEMFQSAWSGAPYAPREEAAQSSRPEPLCVSKIDLIGRAKKIYPPPGDSPEETGVKSQLKAMVDHIADIAYMNQIEPLEGPWQPPLEDRYDLDEILRNAYGLDRKKNAWRLSKRWLAPVVGIYDDPRRQCKGRLRIDFKNGNLLVYGASGTGKTALLQTLMTSLALAHTPKDVCFYVMDFGGGTLKLFEKFPHCGGVMTIDDDVLIKQFMVWIFRMIEERKRAFAELGSFQSYREVGNGDLPAVFILIDNYYALTETYETLEEQMQQVARDGNKFGIYMVATTNTPTFVRYKFSVNFKTVLTFQLTDAMEYTTLIGRTEHLEPVNHSGRGLIRTQYPIEFQAALAAKGKTEAERVAALKETAELLTRLTEERADPIPVMPEKVDRARLLEAAGVSFAALPLGLNNQTLAPLTCNLYQTPILLIADDAGMEKSTLLKLMLRTLCEAYPPERLKLAVIDSSALFLYELSHYPHTEYIDDDESRDRFTTQLEEEIRARKQAMTRMMKSSADITKTTEDWQHLVIAIDHLTDFAAVGDEALKALITTVVRRERHIHISVIATGNLYDLSADWEDIVKAFKEQQCAILFGELRDQELFNIRMPYDFQERHLKKSDGYFINKNKVTGFRCALG